MIGRHFRWVYALLCVFTLITTISCTSTNNTQASSAKSTSQVQLVNFGEPSAITVYNEPNGDGIFSITTDRGLAINRIGNSITVSGLPIGYAVPVWFAASELSQQPQGCPQFKILSNGSFNLTKFLVGGKLFPWFGDVFSIDQMNNQCP